MSGDWEIGARNKQEGKEYVWAYLGSDFGGSIGCAYRLPCVYQTILRFQEYFKNLCVTHQTSPHGLGEKFITMGEFRGKLAASVLKELEGHK